ncbi:MAG: bifunctional folylpolyglutamate synthase/dihydrofolate synthase [Deltaproteobacteria bacterium]|nr:bifunctional folylpolyglutamate synthase/dihydrofolate synthase [Deltaproteobacteria bacterium]
MEGAYREVLAELFARQARRGMKLGVDRVRALLDALGAPDRAYRSVLVAGTNGKGSTCAFTEPLLRAAGKRTALYTSPHLCRFTERIRVDGAEITRDDVVRLHDEVLVAAARVGVEPTFFELTTAMALRHFADKRVEVAVLEVGLGGRLDATNAAAVEVCGITPVDYDHVALLGGTLTEIAHEKAGILRRDVPAWSAPQDPEARAQIARVAEKVGAPLRFLDETDAVAGPLPLPGAHQPRNAALAVALAGGLGVHLSARRTLEALGNTRWPGRLEWLSPGVLLDGAHNPHGARALGRYLRDEPRITAAPRTVWLLAASGERDLGALVAVVREAGARAPDAVVVTQPRVGSAVPADTAAAQVRARLACDLVASQDAAAALDQAAARAGPGVVVGFGSLYAVGQWRAHFTGEDRDDVPLAG